MFKIFIVVLIIDFIFRVCLLGVTLGSGEPIQEEHGTGYYIVTTLGEMIWIYWLWKVLELVSQVK